MFPLSAILGLLNSSFKNLGRIEMKDAQFEQFNDVTAQLLMIGHVFDPNDQHVISSK
jgi:hypothetical protein